MTDTAAVVPPGTAPGPHLEPDAIGVVAAPVTASVLAGLVIIVVAWAYLLATGMTGVLGSVVAVAGLLAAMFCVLTCAAMMAYYRRRIFGTARGFVVLGVLPSVGVAFLLWVIVRSLQLAPAAEKRTIAAIVACGVAVMGVARFGLRPPFFAVAREADAGSAS